MDSWKKIHPIFRGIGGYAWGGQHIITNGDASNVIRFPKATCEYFRPLVPILWFQSDTPWKINMEPTNHPFRKENDLNQTFMIMFHVNLRGCISYLGGGFTYFVHFHPEKFGKIPILTSIFFKWVVVLMIQL